MKNATVSNNSSLNLGDGMSHEGASTATLINVSAGDSLTVRFSDIQGGFGGPGTKIDGG